MSVTAAEVVAEDDSLLAGPLGRRVTAVDSLVELLVTRLHAEFGVDRHEIRCLATEVLGTFAAAPVQAFVPILVEKRLRATYRALRDAGGSVPAGGGPDVLPDAQAVAGRRSR